MLSYPIAEHTGLRNGHRQSAKSYSASPLKASPQGEGFNPPRGRQ